MLLNEELKYEPDERGTHYPHLYGQLNVDAVVGVMDFEPDEEGFFHLPEIVEELKANRTGTLLH